MSLTWNDLFKAGSVVDLNVRIWRAQVQLRPEDLGIADSDEVHKVLMLGSNRLLPHKAFSGILEQIHAAERALRYHSINFPFIHGARYVPEGNMKKLLERLNECQEKFDSAVNTFICNYSSEKEQMLPLIGKALKDASRSEESAKTAFERIQQEYPTPSEVKGKFRLVWSTYAVSGTASGAIADAAAQEKGNVKSVLEDMVSQLREELLAQTKKVLVQVNRGGKIASNTMELTTELLNRLDSLNVLGDQVLSEQISLLRNALASCTDGKASEGMNKGLEGIEKELSASVEKAVADAERALTGLGKRKLVTTKKEVA